MNTILKKGKQHCLSIHRVLSRRHGIKRKSALIILIALFSCFAGNSSSSPTHYCHHSANRMTCQIPALDYVCHQTVCWLTETAASICTFDTMTAFFHPWISLNTFPVCAAATLAFTSNYKHIYTGSTPEHEFELTIFVITLVV